MMRCTRVTTECRRRLQYSVEGANGAACGFHYFQAFPRRICGDYGSEGLGRAITVRLECRDDVEPIEASHMSRGLFTARPGPRNSPAESMRLQLDISQAQHPRREAFALPTDFSSY